MQEILSIPKWHKELDIYREICSAFIIEGNVFDIQALIDDSGTRYRKVSLQHYLELYFSEAGYKYIAFYNKVDGFGDEASLRDKFDNTLHKEIEDYFTSKTVSNAVALMRGVISNTDIPSVVVVYGASFISSDPNRLEEFEMDIWASLFLSSLNQHAAKYKDEKPLSNLLVLVTSKINDVPTWFYVNNPNCKVLHITKPNKDIRKNFFIRHAKELRDYEKLSSGNEIEVKADYFANLTDGFSNTELEGIIKLCQLKDISATQIKKAIDLFKYGEQESKWDHIDKTKIRQAKNFLEESIIGQPVAVEKVTDVIYRSISGLSGIQSGSFGHPRGVLFFAGPTGTGKTEMAKKIAQLLFDDENAVTRFDMSEYNLEHSNQKLIGAPPGYVGYSEGGQLTNAVKDNPFSVLLFDEIDKAHPRIMDTFLQILEDGRITDSAGETVYFSESIIIFTSNIGMEIENNKKISNGGLLLREDFRYEYPEKISPDMKYKEIEGKLITNVASFFDYIKRKEIYNRISGNIVVFDFIREKESRLILQQKIKSIIKRIEEEKGITVEISDEYIAHLIEMLPNDPEAGGRGVVNYLERKLINPLGKTFVEENIVAGSTIEILGVNANGSLTFKTD